VSRWGSTLIQAKGRWEGRCGMGGGVNGGSNQEVGYYLIQRNGMINKFKKIFFKKRTFVKLRM
jgi:hypothetical protein